MANANNGKGIKELFEEVIDQGLCTGCGACITHCPYVVPYEGRIVVLDRCHMSEGDCYKHCPRTYTDMDMLSNKMFRVPYDDKEIGHALEIGMARSEDPILREKGQDGGTTTTLLSLALEERMIDGIVCTRMDDDKVPRGYLARSTEELLQCSGSSYEASFAMEAYRKIPKESEVKLAIVGVGCQIEAISKIKTEAPKNSVNPENIKLTLGLFCGWSLSQNTFHPYLKKNFDLPEVIKFDIPHSPHYTFDVHTLSGKKGVSLDEIRGYINPACQYCWDMTAEFSDISIGSAGSAFPGWNSVIVRTGLGARLIKTAEKRGIIKTQDLPEQRLMHLKSVALKRKKTAFAKIVEKTGSRNNLLYVGGLREDIVSKFLEE